MNRLLFVCFVLFIVGWFSGTGHCRQEDENWRGNNDWQGQSWGRWMKDSKNAPNTDKKSGNKKIDSQWNRSNWQGKFCSDSNEKGLLNLLGQLEKFSGKDKRTKGEVSAIRKKARIIRKLRKYDDCRAEDALRKLSKEDACEDTGEGDLFCLQWVAKASLEEMEAKADLKKLSPDTPFAEQKKIIEKYTTRPYKNDFALQQVKRYLAGQATRKPKVFLSLMTRCFPDDPRVENLLKQYPQLAHRCLQECLDSTDPTVAWWGINLARILENPDFLKRAAEIAFEGKGNIDYSDKAALEELRVMAIGYFRDFESRAIPYYKMVLFSDFDRGKEYIISGIRDLHNPALYALLEEFLVSLQQQSSPASRLLAKRLRSKMEMMEHMRK